MEKKCSETKNLLGGGIKGQRGGKKGKLWPSYEPGVTVSVTVIHFSFNFNWFLMK